LLEVLRSNATARNHYSMELIDGLAGRLDEEKGQQCVNEASGTGQ
jgi:hypothetical protein